MQLYVLGYDNENRMVTVFSRRCMTGKNHDIDPRAGFAFFLASIQPAPQKILMPAASSAGNAHPAEVSDRKHGGVRLVRKDSWGIHTKWTFREMGILSVLSLISVAILFHSLFLLQNHVVSDLVLASVFRTCPHRLND